MQACGLELGFRLYNADLENHDATLIAQIQSLSPEGARRAKLCARSRAHLRGMSAGGRKPADFEPGLMLRALEAHHVRYVVIGAIAAIAAGAPILTTDLDVTPERSEENLERLALALRDLDARLRTASDPDGVLFPIDAAVLGTADSWTLTTRAGDLDLVFAPAGTHGYEDFRRECTARANRRRPSARRRSRRRDPLQGSRGP